MPARRDVDSIIRTNNLKLTNPSFYKRSDLGGGFKSLPSKAPRKISTFQKLTSSYLIITMFFQIIAGVFLYSPASNVEASYNDSWYDAAWSYRKSITINRAKVSHTDNPKTYLSDFPVLVSLIDDDLKASAGKVKKDDGSDIIFTLPDKTPLNYEIESYDKDTGKLVAWVKIPQLNDANNAADTVLYMYYGNALASTNTTVNIQGVWDSSFKMVQHMNQDPSGAAPQFINSTSNVNNGTSSAGMASNDPISGEIGGANSFDGKDDQISCGNNSSLDITSAVTITLWIKRSGNQVAFSKVIDKHGVSSGFFIHFLDDSTNSLAFSFYDSMGTSHSSIMKSIDDNVWTNIAVTFDGNNINIYKNAIGSSVSFNGNISSTTNSTILGGNSFNTQFFSGSLDEVRISSVARSADWIKTEYNNQSDPSSFIKSLGSEENRFSPILSEMIPVSTPTDDSTPSYVFSSSKPGTITYGGDCSSSTTAASIGNNTLAFNLLSAGLHNNCTIKVTDGLGNQSNTLNISPFTINTNLTTYIVPAISDNKILPKSTISDSYKGDVISAQAAPGEYKSLSFVVNSNVNLSSLQIEPSNLHSLSGKTIPASAIDIKAVKVWYQGGYTSSSTKVIGKYLTPELLLKDDSLVSVDEDNWTRYNASNPNGKNYLKVSGAYVDISTDVQASGQTIIPISSRPIQDSSTLQSINLPAEYNKQFWVTLHVPNDTMTGSYDGNIIIKNGSDTVKNLNLDLRVLPINLLEPNVEYGMLYSSSIDDNNGSISSENKTIEQYTAEQEDMYIHGIKNPIIAQFGTDEELLQMLSIRQHVGMDNSKIYTTRSIVNIDEFSYYKNLMFPYGVDELYKYGPDETDLNTLSYRSQINAEHNVGGKHFCSEYIYSYADSVADILDLLIAGGLWPNVAAKYHSYGHKVYLYNNPQTVPEYPYTFRKNYGLSLWQVDYDGAMDFAYQFSMGDIWNDFDHADRDHNFTYPTANGVIDTVQWEGFREGINDMRYLTTLQNAITVAKNSNPDNTTATEAENYLTNLKSSDLVNQDLSAVRSRMTDYILALQSSSYSLTVNNGTGSDFYQKDSRITISADTVPGMSFDKWTGDTHYVSDMNSATTAVIMPAHAVTLIATYKNDALWYDDSYHYRKSITIDHNKVANVNQSNFPILVSLTDNDLKLVDNGGKVQKEEGSDIIFTLPDKTPLSYEIESYDKTTGSLIAWVKIPNLSHLQNTSIYMYYGNSSATANTVAIIQGVWDSSFKMVQHMNQDPSGAAPQFINSTSNVNNGTSSAGM
ncbi:MAG: DUF2341 domain-containing protein, partial [Parabacteroides sp.]|nr:DUF2341 domain-containing protein [Parabacteroides sp.]